nr:helix-turn-helix domain-containing protein [Micromonospora sp. DSM 115978]
MSHHEDAQPARPSGTRGRRQKPIPGYGPVAHLARQLRELASAAELTFEKIADGSDYAKSTISSAASGRKLPTPAVLRRYVTACGVTDPDELREWDRRLHAAGQALAAFRPDLTSVTTVAGLAARLATLVTEQLAPPLDPGTLSERLAANAGRTVGPLRVGPLTPDEIATVLDNGVPLTGRSLGNLLFAAGASAEDIAHWSAHLRRLKFDTRSLDGPEHAAAPTRQTTTGPGNTGPGTTGLAATPAGHGPATPSPTSLPTTTGPTAHGLAGVPRPIVTVLRAGEVLRTGEPNRAAARRSRMLVTATVVTVVALLLGAGAGRELGWWSEDGTGAEIDRERAADPTGTRASGSLGPAADPGLSIAARDKLIALADRVERRSEPPQRGLFTHTHVRTWSRDTTAAGIDVPETRQDERLWWAADGSGRRSYTTDRPAGPAREDVTFDPGEWLPDPAPATDPAAFRDQVREQVRPDAEPVEWLRAAVEPYYSHVLNPAQRAAVLRLIAELPGLAYQGMRYDRMDRAGVAVSLDTPGGAGKPGTQDTLIFDSTTGAPLSHERVLLPGNPLAVGIDTGGDTAGGGPGAASMPSGLDSYVLFVERGRTDRAE